MDTFNNFVTWLNDHETALSAFAALVVIIGVTLSPMGSGLRRAIGRRATHANVDRLPVDIEPAPSSEQNESAESAIARRFSVAVLPFQNMSDDKEQEHIADGLTEDLITDLSHDSRLFVIARNSTFAYKGTSPDIREVGRELDVRYVVEGSLRRMGDTLRITAQLIETDTGTHVWADKIDRPYDEFFAAQDDITNRIVTAICSHLNIAEKARFQRQNPDSLEAWELCVRAETGFQSGQNETTREAGEQLTRRATELEPDYTRAWALFGYFKVLGPAMGLSDDPEKDIAEGLAAVAKALEIAPADPLVLAYKGIALARSGRYEEALGPLGNSLERNPNFSLAQFFTGSVLTQLGRGEDALLELDRFLKQNPKDPMLYMAYCHHGIARWVTGDLNNAKTDLHKSTELYGGFHIPWIFLGVILHELGLESEARTAIDEARHVEQELTLDAVTGLIKQQYIPELAGRMIGAVRQNWVD